MPEALVLRLDGPRHVAGMVLEVLVLAPAVKPIWIETYLFPASNRQDTIVTLTIGRWWKSWTWSKCIACGDRHEPVCRSRRKFDDPPWTARELLS